MRTLKKTLALVLVVAMMMSLCITASAFDDADEITYTEAVEVMTAIGVVNGMGDGTFAPNGTLTRGQAAAIITRLLGAEDFAVAKSDFTDCAGHWADKYVAYCAAEGIVDGYGDGTFGPDDELTGYQFAKMLLAALGADTSEMTGSAWQIAVAKAAAEYDIFADNAKADKTQAATREEACLYALNAALYTSESETYAVGEAEFDDYMDAVVFALLTGAGLEGIDTLEASGTLLEDVHGVAHVARTFDAFGRPYALYYDLLTGGYMVYIPVYEEAVYTTTEAVKSGALYTLLGKPAVRGLNYTVNGLPSSDIVADDIVSGGTAVIGAPGQVTEVYNLGRGVYSVVTYNVWAGLVTDWSAAKYDKDGDLLAHQMVEVASFDGTFEGWLVSYDFTKADVNNTVVYATAVTDGTDWYVASADVAEIVTGTMSKYNTTKNSYTIGGEVYAKNVTSAAITGAAGVETHFFLDGNGYIIGASDVYVAPNYAVVTQIVKVTPASTGAIGEKVTNYLQAELLYMDGTTEIVTVASVVAGETEYAAEADRMNGLAAFDDTAKAAVEQGFVTYAVNGDGEYILTALDEAISKTGALKASTTFIAGEKANNKTVFIIRSGNAFMGYSYTAYTGYTKLPASAYTSATVLGLENVNGVATYVYITNGEAAAAPVYDLAFVIGSGTYIYSNLPAGSYYEYNVVLNGELTTIEVSAKVAQPEAGKLYAITGYHAITGMATLSEAIELDTVKAAAYEGVIEFTAAGAANYTGDEVVYIINPITGEVTEGAVTDLEKDQAVYVTFTKDVAGNYTEYIDSVIAVEVLD